MDRNILYGMLNCEDRDFVDFLKSRGLELTAFQLIHMYPYLTMQLGVTTANIVTFLKPLAKAGACFFGRAAGLPSTGSP